MPGFHAISDAAISGDDQVGNGVDPNESTAILLISIGQFDAVIRAVVEQPSLIIGGSSYRINIFGRSSSPPGIGEIILGGP